MGQKNMETGKNYSAFMSISEVFPELQNLFQLLFLKHGRPVKGTLEMDPRVVPTDRGTLKNPRVGWEFSRISAFAWVFFAPPSHSDPTHRVGPSLGYTCNVTSVRLAGKSDLNSCDFEFFTVLT